MKNNSLNRRDFMKLLAKGSTVGAMGSVSQLALMENAVAAAPTFPKNDYKALVCIFFFGGNDGFNMLVPTESSSYNNYKKIRAALALKNRNLATSTLSKQIKNGTLGKGTKNPYNVDSKRASAYTKGYYDLKSNNIDLGVNAVMPEFAQLIYDKKLSLIANAGNLVTPVTQKQIKNKTANLPLFLFAHNHQQRLLQTGQANKLNDIGWAGKIADSWKGINNNSPFGLNVSYTGSRRLMIGNQTSPLILGFGEPKTFKYLDNSPSRYNQDRRDIFKKLIAEGQASGSAFQNLLANAHDGTFKSFDILQKAWNETSDDYSAKGSYGENLFARPSKTDLGFDKDLGGTLIKGLETVAKMIDLGANDKFQTNGYNRQIFLVGMGGYDTHADQPNRHSLLMRELSVGLWKFQKALEERGHADKVTTFSMSDFGRTLSINSGKGTDHAWGSHHFAMGGAVNGGKLFGTLPELIPGGKDDYYKKGRLIPTTSQDQINASICEWFGVSPSLVQTIFPNLSNFTDKSGKIESAYIQGLFS